MNLDWLHTKLATPHLLSGEDIPVLKELTNTYPYCQLYSILLLKALANTKDLRFDEFLQQHAYKITDRSKLYELIQHQQTVFEIPPAEEAQIEEVEEIIASKAAFEETFVDQLNEETTAIEHTTQSIEFEREESSVEEPKVDQEMLALEKEILANIVATSYSLEREEEKIKKEQKKADLDQPRSFSDWLSLGSSQVEMSKNAEVSINQEPKIEKKAEFYSATKKAKESVSEEGLIYSETLANIFALQGNFPKAIQAFEQLMLVNPEKKLYFAQKIEELKQKINA